MNLLRNLDIVVAVDAQDVLDQVGFTLHIDTVRRNGYAQCVAVLFFDFYVQRQDNPPDRFIRHIFAHQSFDAAERNVEPERSHRNGIKVRYRGADLSSRQFHHQQGCPFHRIRRYLRIDSAFETERGIGAQPVAFGAFANPNRIEISALDEYVRRGFGHARIEPPEYAGDTHRFLRIADHQVFVREFTLHTVQSDERSTLGARADDHFAAFDLAGIECVQRLANLVQDEICNVDDVVVRIQPDRTEPVLEPFGRFGHFDAGNGDTHISGSGFRVEHLYRNFFVGNPFAECRDIRKYESVGNAVRLQVYSQVARHAIMRHRIGAVGRQSDFEQVVVFDLVVVPGRSACRHIVRQHDNPVVAGPDADFILGTEHSQRLHAADFALFYFEAFRLAGRIQHRIDRCNDYFRSGGYIRRTADDLGRGTVAQIDGRYVQLVGVGMLLAGEDFTHDQP